MEEYYETMHEIAEVIKRGELDIYEVRECLGYGY